MLFCTCLFLFDFLVSEVILFLYYCQQIDDVLAARGFRGIRFIVHTEFKPQ